MKKYLIILSCCWILSFSPVQGMNSLLLSKNNEVFIDFKKHTGIKNLLATGDLSFRIEGIESLHLVKKNNVLYFHITQFSLTDTGSLVVQYKNKIKKIPLQVDYEPSQDGMDIFEDLLYTRIQGKPLSCESSAAADIASFLLSKNITEDDVIEYLPKNLGNTTAKSEGNISIWGDPNRGFVGYIDYFGEKKEKPSQKKMTGYGVYEKPVSQVLEQFGLSSEIINRESHSGEFTPQEHLEYLLSSLEQGKMVELWGDWCTRTSYEDGSITKAELTPQKAEKKIGAKNECYDVDQERKLEWYYYNSQGKLQKHMGLAGEHTFILLGWKGEKKNPTHIIVWDTDTGYHQYKTEEWMRKWEKMDYRSLIIAKN